MYMKLKEDQEKVRTLLCDTVTLLCKNGLTFSKELRVEGLLGITLDQTEVFIVHINEKLGSDDINGVVTEQLEVSPRQKSRKRGHTTSLSDDASPPKRTNHSMSDKVNLYDTFNNNISESFVKKEKLDEEEGEEEEKCLLEDDRNAMRFCYNLDDQEEDNHTGHEDILQERVRRQCGSLKKQPPVTPTQEELHSSPRSTASATESATDYVDDLQPPDPSMGGPFITGIVSDVERRTVAVEGEDETWDELPQLGTLTAENGGPVILDTSRASWNASVKGHQQSKPPESKLVKNLWPNGSSFDSAVDFNHGTKTRRSPYSSNKHYICQEPGCHKKFFESKNLRRHENLKHGRMPAFRRKAAPTMVNIYP